MKILHSLTMAAACVLLLSACGRDPASEDEDLFTEQAEPAQPAQAAAPAGAVQEPVGVQPTVLRDDALLIGNAVGANGAVNATKPAYTLDDTLYASVPAGGYPSGTEVTIYWFGPGGTSIKEERKAIPAGAGFVNFSLSRADGMTAGQYTAQVDVGDMPVGIVNFSVN